VGPAIGTTRNPCRPAARLRSCTIRALWMQEYRFGRLRLDRQYTRCQTTAPRTSSRSSPHPSARAVGAGERGPSRPGTTTHKRGALSRATTGWPARATIPRKMERRLSPRGACRPRPASGTGYYADYEAAPIHALPGALVEGFTYQGEVYSHRTEPGAARRGVCSPPTAFVNFRRTTPDRKPRFGRAAVADGGRARAACADRDPRAGRRRSRRLPFMGEEKGERAACPVISAISPASWRQAVREGRKREFAHDVTGVGFGEAARSERRKTLPARRFDWGEADRAKGDATRMVSNLLTGAGATRVACRASPASGRLRDLQSPLRFKRCDPLAGSARGRASTLPRTCRRAGGGSRL